MMKKVPARASIETAEQSAAQANVTGDFLLPSSKIYLVEKKKKSNNSYHDSSSKALAWRGLKDKRRT